MGLSLLDLIFFEIRLSQNVQNKTIKCLTAWKETAGEIPVLMISFFFLFSFRNIILSLQIIRLYWGKNNMQYWFHWPNLRKNAPKNKHIRWNPLSCSQFRVWVSSISIKKWAQTDACIMSGTCTASLPKWWIVLFCFTVMTLSSSLFCHKSSY